MILRKFAGSALGAIGFLALVAGATLADRPPSAEERARIEPVLREQGFTRWGEIELDDGAWEVDEAYAEDGRKYELKLHQQTLQIIKRKLDD